MGSPPQSPRGLDSSEVSWVKRSLHVARQWETAAVKLLEPVLQYRCHDCLLNAMTRRDGQLQMCGGRVCLGSRLNVQVAASVDLTEEVLAECGTWPTCSLGCVLL